ncbi:MAG: glycoside hydrolase family 2 protein [Bacteroidales bacterium]|nr:glycoside hydrolase family 2 protein [Bacteroidales bacterium]
MRYLLCGFALALMLSLASCSQHHGVIEQPLTEGWTLTGDTLEINTLPVKVPSVVQQNLFDADMIPHPYYGVVEDELLWISDHPWTYTAHFDAQRQLLHLDAVELVFEGIDTYASVNLNGEKLFEADNQFRIWKADVKHLLKDKDNVLEVHFPRYDSLQQAFYDQHHPKLPEKYAVSRKAPYQHGWDWAPKYKNVGIWKPVKLVGWSDARLENAYIVTKEVSEEQAVLTLHVDVESVAEGELVAEIRAEGKTLQSFPFEQGKGNQHKLFNFTIANPRLWWPNEMGDQPLYDFEVELKQQDKLLDSKMIRTGIKTVEMVEDPDDVGFSFYFKVNGVPMYAKGANYVPEEMIETWIDADNTLRLLRQAQEVHFNMLRVWGGGIYPSDDFFNICDSLGILVWEDFMYAGTMYPYDSAFLENAKIEALEQVKRLASHPSLALWCGGNEISEGYYNWGWQQSLGWTEEEDQAIKTGYDRLFEGILPTVVSTFDGTRPYWPSSPSKGWGRPESLTQGDVHYWGVWWGELPYEVYREKVGRFNSEYGYQSYPDYSTLQSIALGEPLSKEAKVIAAHQKHPRGTRQIDDFIHRYYPIAQPKDFEEYVHLSQLSQAYGMEIAIEAHRTAKPYNMGTLYWQLNDAWPVTSWSSIDYFGHPKVFHEKLKTLFAPVLLSLDQKDFQVFVTSDLLRAINGELSVSVVNDDGTRLFEQKVKVELNANENKKFYVDGLDDALRQSDLQKVVVQLELNEGDTLVAKRDCYFFAPSL